MNQSRTPERLRLVLLPPKKVGEDVAADMEVANTDNSCGICGKPFDAARKWRSRATLTYGRDLKVMFSWKLCGKCTREARVNGCEAPERLVREAESACNELLSKPEFTA